MLLQGVVYPFFHSQGETMTTKKISYTILILSLLIGASRVGEYGFISAIATANLVAFLFLIVWIAATKGRILKNVLSVLLFLITKEELAEATLMDHKGNFVKPFNHLKCNTLDLEVVGLALSNIMRFFGQTKLSVAQHCVNMARVFIYQGQIELAKQALLHEVSEAFMGDLASPVKRAFPMFKMIEESLIKKTFVCFNLSYPMDEEVHVLDKRIVLNEAIVHMPKKKYWKAQGRRVSTQLLTDSGVELQAWSSEKAYAEFIIVAKQLGLL